MDDAQLIVHLQGQLEAERKAHEQTRRILATIAPHTIYDPERKRREAKFQRLTKRQREVVHTAAKQGSLRAAAECLFLSQHTVIWHLKAAQRRAGVGSRKELYQLAT